MANLGVTLATSLKYGFSTSVKNPLRWLALTIVSIIPIVNFIAVGIFLKIFRDEEPTFEHAGRCFIQGLLAVIIALIYNIIPIIVFFLCGPLGVVGTVISCIVSILFMLVAVPALVIFARTGKFGKAFSYAEISSLIKKTTVVRYLLGILIYLVVFLIISVIFAVLSIIPPLAIIVAIIVAVPLSLFFTKFCHGVFS